MIDCSEILRVDLLKNINEIKQDGVFEILSLELTPQEKHLLDKEKLAGIPVYCNEHLAVSRIIIARNRRIDYKWIE